MATITICSDFGAPSPQFFSLEFYKMLLLLSDWPGRGSGSGTRPAFSRCLLQGCDTRSVCAH